MPGIVHLNANAVFARLVAVDAAAVVIASGESARGHVNHQSVKLGRWVTMIASVPNPELWVPEPKLYFLNESRVEFGLRNPQIGYRETQRKTRPACLVNNVLYFE